jgi:hypothetical protein
MCERFQANGALGTHLGTIVLTMRIGYLWQRRSDTSSISHFTRYSPV